MGRVTELRVRADWGFIRFAYLPLLVAALAIIRVLPWVALISVRLVPCGICMLHWEAGMRETDGIWASHWYDTVAASTGFGSPDRGSIELDGEARRVADACRPFYERLAKHRITA